MRDRIDCAQRTLSRLCPEAGAAILALCLGFLTIAPASAADLYRVAGVAVDGRGKSAKAAKAAAIAKGQKAALGRLLQRLTLRRDRKRLPTAKGKALDALVKSHEVENQRAGSRRYRGRLAFVFHPAKVRSLLRKAGVSFVETGSKPVLVLAVWQKGDLPVLWDDPNPWRDSWRHLSHKGLVEYLRPGGSLKDVRAVSAEQALKLDAAALAAIAQSYGASTVLVAQAAVKGATAEILVRRYNTVTGKPRLVGRYQSGISEAALSKTAAKIATEYEESWKTANIVPAGATSTLTVRAPLRGLSYWVRLRDGLRQVRLIRRQRIVSLTPAMAVIQLGHAGGVRQLTEALRQNDIELRKGGADGDAEVWELRLLNTGADRRPEKRNLPKKKNAE